ncbi:V-type proton ATPase subunit E [subsurface metagenome]
MIRLGAKEIVGKIKDEANVECEKIMSEAKENAKKKVEEVRKEIEVQKKRFIEAEERRGVEEKERIVRAARLNARKLGWDAEEEMIAKALEEAMNRLKVVKTEGFKGNSYSGIMAGLTKDAAMSIIAGSSAGDELDVIISEEDASFVKPKMLKKISDEINQDSGANVRLSLSGERIKSAGGVIVRGKEGKVAVNNTVEQRMARLSASLREDIVKTLFISLSL